MADTNDDDELLLTMLEVTMADPGGVDLDDDESSALQPLCRECLRDLPVGDSSLCEFCRAVGAGQ